jgi:beta-phosphoglucomutase
MASLHAAQRRPLVAPSQPLPYSQRLMTDNPTRFGVIFDMDGVLVDSGPAHFQSWRILAQQEGIHLTEADFRRTFGMSSRDIIRLLWGKDLTDQRILELDSRKEAIYRQLITGRVPLVPGAAQTVQQLWNAGYVLAIGSSGPPENIELVLQQSGLRRYFAATVNGLEVQRGKPAPDIFLLAAQRANVPAANCVVVEDAPAGIAAALAAGMAVIGFAAAHSAQSLREAGAHCVVASLPQITPPLVRQLIQQAQTGR